MWFQLFSGYIVTSHSASCLALGHKVVLSLSVLEGQQQAVSKTEVIGDQMNLRQWTKKKKKTILKTTFIKD